MERKRCLGGNCPIKNTCDRFMNIWHEHHEWFNEPPYNDGCKYHIPVDYSKIKTQTKVEDNIRMFLSDPIEKK